MDPRRPLRALDRYQQRHTPLAVPAAVVKKFGDDDGGDLAALIAYRAFFSLFPLLLVLTTVLGYVLEGNPDLRQEAVDSTLAQFPVIGDQIKLSSLEGNGIALAVGVVGSLWAGLGVVLATERALDRVWAVPRRDRSGFLASRLRALTLLFVLGALTIASTVASGLVGGGAGLLGPLAGIAVSIGAQRGRLRCCLHALGTTVDLPARLAARNRPRRGLLVCPAAGWRLLRLPPDSQRDAGLRHLRPRPRAPRVDPARRDAHRVQRRAQRRPGPWPLASQPAWSRPIDISTGGGYCVFGRYQRIGG